MKTGEIFNPKEEKQERMKKFEVIDGGLAKPEGKEPPKTNWLYGLADGTVFLAHKAGRPEVVVTKFQVCSHLEHCVELQELGSGESYTVHALNFSTQMKLVEVISE